jgi:1-deoxy-D-xylulose-5-phosphate synthase
MCALEVGRAEYRRQGSSGLALLAFGTMLAPALQLAERLNATVVNMRFVKPLDLALLREVAANHVAIVTLEENVVAGGAGSGCAEALDAEGLSMPWLHIGIPDRCIEHGSRQDCLEAAGLDATAIATTIERWRAQVPALKLPRAAAKLTAAGGAGTL